MKYDAIIVGSGIAGMTSAAILALEGKKILMLEQHNIFGGLMQNFRRDRLTFPTGVHCVGALSEGQVLWRYFDYLGVLNRMEWVKMDPDGFQSFVLPSKTFSMPTGHAEFKERILSYFPDERVAMDTFMADMKSCMERSPYYQIDPALTFQRRPLDTISLQSYLDSITNSPGLKGVLSASFPLYGIQPSQCPLMTHFSVLDSFLQSSYRVDERAKPLAKAFMFRLRELGVDMRRSAEVEEIECEGRTLKGVRLTTGETFHSDIVLFSGHPAELVERCPRIRPAFKWRISGVENTDSFFSIGLSWEHPKCPPSLSDAFIYNSDDMEASSVPWDLKKEKTPRYLYVAASPNPERERYAVTALASTSYKNWAEWGSTSPGQRGDQYAALKQEYADTMLEQVKSQWPEAAASITLVDSNTPLTQQNFTQSPLGTSYGVKKRVDDRGMSQIGNVTSIKGLYMIGQSSQLPGIVGTVISSVQACSHIVGVEYLLAKIAKASH